MFIDFLSQNSWGWASLPNPTTWAGSSSTDITYAPQDNPTLYHTSRWFVPSNVISTVGTTVTTVAAQFTAAMVGSKLTINGENRIITAFTSATVVTVWVAYSTNYTNVPSPNWWVYSKLMDTLAGITNFYTITWSSWIAQSGWVANSAAFAWWGGNFQLWFSWLDLATSNAIRFSNTTNHAGSKDVWFRRNNIGLIEIYDGVTNGTLRDLTLRKILVNTSTDNGIDQLQVNGSATLWVASATTPQLNIIWWASGSALVRLVRTVWATAAFQWTLSTGGMTFIDETNWWVPLALYGGTILSAHIWLRNTSDVYTTPSLLWATTFTTGAGPNVPATNFTIQGSLGTGTGAVGDIYFNTGNTAASGSVHTSSTKMTLTGAGNLGINIIPIRPLHILSNVWDWILLERNAGGNINIQYKNTLWSMFAGLSQFWTWGIWPNADIGTSGILTVTQAGNVIVWWNTANANAILDIQSTTRAFMPPRMTTAQKNAIPSPTAWMLVYDTTLNAFSWYTTSWITL